MNTLFKRTSIRKYLDKAVEEEKIEWLLKAAMAAPSAANQQPWEFYVVTDREKLAALAQCSPYAGWVKEAPAAIVSCYRDELPMPEYAHIDMAASTENLLIEATELGLGAVWLGIAPVAERMEHVRAILEIPPQLTAFAIIALGYPAKAETPKDRYEPGRIHKV